MMWRTVQARVESRGGTVALNADVVRVVRAGRRVEAVVVSDGRRETVVQADDVLSSMPLAELIMKLDPPPPRPVVAAAERLRYRDFLTVCLIVNRPHVFPDNWIYIHDPEVRVGRIQNFKNWSPDMVPDPGKSSLGLEYFCTEGDALWRTADADLIALGTREIERVGLAAAADVEDGCVVRMAKAYPIYDSDYRDALATIREFVDGLENLQTIGRNGLHRYNNQDHAMVTGMRAARNVVLEERHDLWAVNVDQEYHEELRADVEAEGVAGVVESSLTRVFNKLDAVALGAAVGCVTGLGLGLATLVLALTGARDLALYLGLLREYFPGYRITVPGSLFGLVYGAGAGFVAGWGFAIARNAALALYLTIAYGRAEKKFLRQMFDHM
jgi:hypothetical protein